jgi:hypothetical protein
MRTTQGVVLRSSFTGVGAIECLWRASAATPWIACAARIEPVGRRLHALPVPLAALSADSRLRGEAVVERLAGRGRPEGGRPTSSHRAFADSVREAIAA